MKQKLRVKYPLIATLLVAVALCLLGLPYSNVSADPPEPTPSPAMDIRTRLQPYQTSGVAPSQPDGRLFEEAPSRPDVNAEPVELLPGPAVAIRTKLQPYQIPGIESSQSDGRLLKEAPPSSEVEEAPISAQAQRTFYSIADATVLQGYPTQNVGDTTDMWAGYDDLLNPDGKIVRSLVKFNIAGLPANQVITKATLRVRLVNSWDFPNTYRTITTYRVISNWSESTINWNNAPGYGSAYGSKSIRNDDFTWHEFDVTNLVTAWYNGAYTNYGIMLRGPEISGLDSSWRGFSTREGSFTPQLVIEYQDGTPPPPSNLTALALSQMQILLQWQDNSNNETGFKIEQSLASIGPWTQIATTPANVTSYAPSGLNCGQTYYYRVRAYNASGNSPYSNIANATTSPCTSPPVAPSSLIATAISQTQIGLSWTDNSNDESGFKIERSPNSPGNWVQVATALANSTSYLNAGLTCGTTYYYRVRAYNGFGNSAYSNVANATTTACGDSSYNIYLPIVIRPSLPPPDGHWAGTTSRGQPMSFDVSGGGATWSNFKLKTDFSFGGCSGTVEVTIPGPGTITNNQFSSSGSGGAFSFSGQLTSLTTASGTYAFVNDPTGCGSLTQSGTWTGNVQ
jgi:hypothetical protein